MPDRPSASEGPKRPLYLTSVSIALIVVVLVAVAALAFWGGWYASNHNKNSKSSSNNTSSSVWAEYPNQKYGFKLNYLKSWGAPRLSVGSQQTSSGSSATTSLYTITFSNTSSSKQPTLYISFSADSAPASNCAQGDKNCPAAPSLSASSIRALLSQNKSQFVKYTASSFTTLTYPSTSLSTAILNIVQIVNLPKLSVSAAGLNYTLSNVPQSCPRSQLAPSTQDKCITQSDYTNFSQSLSSLSPL